MSYFFGFLILFVLAWLAMNDEETNDRIDELEEELGINVDELID